MLVLTRKVQESVIVGEVGGPAQSLESHGPWRFTENG